MWENATTGAVFSHSALAGELLEAIPVGDEGGDHYLVVPVDVKVAIDRATSFYHWQSYFIECYSSYHRSLAHLSLLPDVLPLLSALPLVGDQLGLFLLVGRIFLKFETEALRTKPKSEMLDIKTKSNGRQPKKY